MVETQSSPSLYNSPIKTLSRFSMKYVVRRSQNDCFWKETECGLFEPA